MRIKGKVMAAVRAICFTMLLSAFPFRASAEDFTNAIDAFLQQRVEVEKRDVGIVVGIVDEHGSSIVSCGRMDNGAAPEVNGDTLFEIGSITKTFTVLLLQDMVERGEMKLDDPVAKYLPKSVKMPTRNGKNITLLQLATHTSGLPRGPDNHTPKRREDTWADYTVEEMYAFLSGYQLTRDPGAQSEYSNLGMGLLGHVIALKAGTNYESLVVDRICRPLKMDSTRITLTPELESRFATGHTGLGYAASSWDCPTLSGAGALRSTANDMLKYVSANLGLTPSRLTPLMEETHVAHFHLQPHQQNDIGLAWEISRDQHGRKIVRHGGATDGFSTFAGFDPTQRRGVVVLSNTRDDVEVLAMLLLGSKWQSDQRPKEIKISSQDYDSYVGQYELSPDFALGMFIVRRILLSAPKSVIYIPAGLSLAAIFVLFWRVAGVRKRWIIVGCAAFVSSLLAALIVVVLARTVCARAHVVVGIRREGDRLFAQNNDNEKAHTIAELLPESESRFFERMSGISVTFSRGPRGKVTRLTVQIPGAGFSFAKISDQPPKAPEPPKPHVAIKLDTKLLDACTGRYKFSPNAMSPAETIWTFWREGDHLVLKVGQDPSAEFYPESETNFFLKINGAQLTFIKNEKGEVTAVIHRLQGFPDCEGKKLENE